MPETSYLDPSQEPFEGYSEAIGGLQGAMVGGQTPAPQSSESLEMLKRELYGELRRNVQEEQKPEKPLSLGQKLLLSVPGAAQGYAARKRLDREEEELKLRKQQLEGAKASQRLKALGMLQQIEQQERAQHLGRLYGAYVGHEDVLDDEAKAELRGGIVRQLAEAGEVSGIQAFQKAEQEREINRGLQQLLTQQNAAQLPQSFIREQPVDAAPVQPEQQVPGQGALGNFNVKPMARALIIRAAQEEGVDPNLALAVAEQESGGNQDAVSPAGAIGVMQLMPATAKDLGVNPRDIRQNIRGGVRYLKQQLDDFDGDVELALAAYNAGPGRVRSSGGVPNIKETQNYVAKIGRRLAQLDRESQVQGPQRTATDAGPAQAGPLGRYRVELARTTQELELTEAKMRQLLPFSHTAQGAKVLERLEKQRDNLSARRKELESLVYGAGTSEAELLSGGDLRFASPEERRRVADELQQRRVETSRQQGVDAAERTAATTTAREDAIQAAKLRNEQQITPKERREAHADIRSAIRVEPAYKALQTYADAYKSVEQGARRNDGPGDLALVYGVARLAASDQSVVREAEFSNVESAQGKLQQILNTPEKFFTGNRLTPEARQKFLTLSADLYREKGLDAQQELEQIYKPQAEAYGIPFSELVRSRKFPDTSAQAVSEQQTQQPAQQGQKPAQAPIFKRGDLEIYSIEKRK